MKKKGALEAGYCTAPLCRKIVKPGDGNQWTNPKGDPERYCWACWKALLASQDRGSEPKKGGEK